jgi:hypothetical protein
VDDKTYPAAIVLESRIIEALFVRITRFSHLSLCHSRLGYYLNRIYRPVGLI